jgi:hypothetical protein
LSHGATTTHVVATARAKNGVDVRVAVLVEYSLHPVVAAQVVGMVRHEYRESVTDTVIREELERAITGSTSWSWNDARDDLAADLERRLAAGAVERGIDIHEVLIESLRCEPAGASVSCAAPATPATPDP